MTRIRRLEGITVATSVLPNSEIVAGAPRAGATELAQLGGAEIGLWEMTVGAASDVEADECFLVLTGRATILFTQSGESVEIAAGDFVTLHAGEQTEWTVHEPLRKLYIAA
ncbi:cupin domain-containing protein [Humidisolicoccus flavus]|uniref:cupin domain-containing protein n=1 Tax=Humidisolicoccus flavus TaxID=3111414 RepID=UPI003253D778